MKHGVFKPLTEHGYAVEDMTTIQNNEKLEELVTVEGVEYVKRIDPTGKRTGLGLIVDGGILMKTSVFRRPLRAIK